MQTIHYTDLVHRFAKVPVKQLKFLTPIEKIKSLLSSDSSEPENLKNTFYEPSEIYVQIKHKIDKKQKEYGNTKQFVVGKKAEENKDAKQTSKQVKQQPESWSPLAQEKKRIYRPGPFALFYELNEKKLNKDEQVWFYKQQKDIIGPVSSYNMDRMAYYKNVNDDTKVAYKSVDKFVKFSKVKKAVETENDKRGEQPISSEQSQ